MTIQRQYSLPNCRLVLEGWGEDASVAANFMEGRPVMTILSNAECHIVGREQPLSGGREFLDQLVAGVNQYAQQVLSGIPHLVSQAAANSSLVSLKKTEDSLHRLTIQLLQEDSSLPTNGQKSETHIDLSTVQLFDLVEAIDQMVADAQTLPDIYLDLTPVPKRSVASQEPITNRVIPATLGVSGLAIAAFALFYIPTPEFEPADPEATTTEESVDGASPDRTSPGPDPESNNQSNSRSEQTAEPTASSSPDDDTNGSAARSPAASLDELPSQDDIEELLTSATPIADVEQLDTLTVQLRDQIVDSWEQPPTFDEDLEYRVGVSDNGDIVGFKFVNDAALTYVDDVPLLDLTNIPIDPEAIVEEPVGQFKVVFRPSGVVEVSPWYGRPPTDDES